MTFGDGIEDILVTDLSSNSLKLFRGNPEGSFSQPTDVLTGGESDEIAIADFNNDGALDIAVNLIFEGRISIMLNNGSGSFSNSSFLVDEQPYDIISFDANGDEFPDLAIGHNSGKNVKVYPNPVSTTLVIQEKDSREIKSVEIINALGQSIKYREHTNELIEIDVSDLGQGHYTIVIRSSKEIVTRKIIVR